MPFDEPTDDERYRAVCARDRRFDGQFVMAVHSTGIYCRPSCPARTPKRDGVSFYPTSAAAHQAGYRACKRCLPEATPGSPAWNIRQDVAARAMRLILDGYVGTAGAAGLAQHLGYSSRQLDRILVAELGAGPKALSRAHRAQSARALLTSTNLAISEVAFAAGFGSIRQCNDTMREVFALTPTEIRARGRAPEDGGGHTASRPGGNISRHAHVPDSIGQLRLWLPAREPFDADGLLDWLSVRALPGLESTGPGVYERVLRLPGGPAWFSARPTAGASADSRRQAGVEVRIRLTALSDLPALVAHVRSLFDLDADPVAVDAALGSIPELRAAVDATPGIRVPGAVDAHELVIRAIIGQQVSVASARTALTRLVVELGDPVPGGIAPEARLFPTMTAIAEHGAGVLRGPQKRIDTILRVAAALAEGSVVVDRGRGAADLRASLQQIPGIGPWTASYIALRVLQYPDLFLPEDSAVRVGASALGLPSEARALTTWAERAAPWRSYLTMHLWRAAGGSATATFTKTSPTSTTAQKASTRP